MVSNESCLRCDLPQHSTAKPVRIEFARVRVFDDFHDEQVHDEQGCHGIILIVPELPICVGGAKIAPDQQSRMAQREMAAEWLRLAGTLECEHVPGSIPIERFDASNDE